LISFEKKTDFDYFSEIDNSMSDSSDKANEAIFRTPLKDQVRPNSYKEVYLSSITARKTNNSRCSLCLLFSSDCSSFRCTDSSHLVCSECACDWEADHLCPVCKKRSTVKGKKKEKTQWPSWAQLDKTAPKRLADV
jgi:hypothetical protein